MKDLFKLTNYDLKIPKELIAQEPVSPRDSSRLLVINRKDKSIQEVVFKDVIDFLNTGDVLILNDTRVIKAKLSGKKESGSKIDVLLVKEKQKGIWEVLLNPGKRIKPNDVIIFGEGTIRARALEKTLEGGRVLDFNPAHIEEILANVGEPPLPHYIKKKVGDFNKYQTVYAKKEGAIAAPTAGLHFTPELLRRIEKKGISIAFITLHCGLATFRPVKTQDIREHKINTEYLEISQAAADVVNKAKENRCKVVAQGTTSIRALESVAFMDAYNKIRIKPFSGETNLYITPGYKFKIIDAVLTNFHTPCSTNLILVSSFCGLDLTRHAYAYAVKKKFRLYSFGDAMLII